MASASTPHAHLTPRRRNWPVKAFYKALTPLSLMHEVVEAARAHRFKTDVMIIGVDGSAAMNHARTVELTTMDQLGLLWTNFSQIAALPCTRILVIFDNLRALPGTTRPSDYHKANQGIGPRFIEMLGAFGFVVIYSKGEAAEDLAQLQREGRIGRIISYDVYPIAFGAREVSTWVSDNSAMKQADDTALPTLYVGRALDGHSPVLRKDVVFAMLLAGSKFSAGIAGLERRFAYEFAVATGLGEELVKIAELAGSRNDVSDRVASWREDVRRALRYRHEAAHAAAVGDDFPDLRVLIHLLYPRRDWLPITPNSNGTLRPDVHLLTQIYRRDIKIMPAGVYRDQAVVAAVRDSVWPALIVRMLVDTCRGWPPAIYPGLPRSLSVLDVKVVARSSNIWMDIRAYALQTDSTDMIKAMYDALVRAVPENLTFAYEHEVWVPRALYRAAVGPVLAEWAANSDSESSGGSTATLSDQDAEADEVEAGMVVDTDDEA